MWDPAAKRSRVQVVYNFGREDAANRQALQRLVASVARFVEPGKALAAAAGEDLEFIESRPLAGPVCWMHCGSGWGSGRCCGVC